MTPQQEHLIRQALGALKAALGAAPELPFEDLTKEPPPPSSADLWKMKTVFKELAGKLYAVHGTRPIDYNDAAMRRMAFDMGIVRVERFLISLEERGIIKVERQDMGMRSRFISFRFVKSMA